MLVASTQIPSAPAHTVDDGPFFIRYGPDSSEEDRARVVAIIADAVKQAPNGAVYLCSTESSGGLVQDAVAAARKSLLGSGITDDRIHVGAACADVAATNGTKDAVFAAIGPGGWLESIYSGNK